MHVGVIHLGRTGTFIVRRLLAADRRCVVYDRSARTVVELAAERAHGAASVPDLVNELDGPRTIWLTGRASEIDPTISELLPYIEPDDVILDCSDSDYADSVRRAAELAVRHVHYLDVGICGEMQAGSSYCLMLGGDESIARSLQPLLELLAPRGYLYCGPAGAGRFVATIHDGIECRMTAAYSEGFRMLRAASTAWTDHGPDYEFALSDI